MNYRVSFICGCVGMVIGLFAFTFNYHMTDMSLPGYRVIAAPAMFMLSFFSEETDFVAKMVLFLSGQFIGYFCLSAIVLWISKGLRR